MTNEEAIKMDHKYSIEFEENVCAEHLPILINAISECLEISDVETEEKHVSTAQSVRMLFGVAEYGLRGLMDIMMSDKKCPIESKKITLSIINNDLMHIRERIDIVLTHVESELNQHDQ